MSRNTPKWCHACFLAVLVGLPAAPAVAIQEIYIDFDSVKDAYDSDPGLPGLPPVDEIYVYSPEQRDFIVSYLNSNFEMYEMLFLEGPRPLPKAFSASEVTVNKGFGAGSEGVDFRNLNDDDDAALNTISIFKFLGKTAGEWSDMDVAIATANIAGHEASHLMGARHHDALGPIGMGVGGGIAPGDFLPVFPGPSGADETSSAFMSLHFGGSLSFENMTSEKFVSERLVPRLLMASSVGDSFLMPEVAPDNHTLAMAQPIGTPFFTAPYPARPPLPPGAPIPVSIDGYAAVVTGMLDSDGGDGFMPDYFSFFAVEGEQWTIEAMSYILEEKTRYADNADVAIVLLDESGAVVPYHAGDAFADDDDDHGGEYFGATLLDIVIPETGIYTIEVVASAPFIGTGKDGKDGGSYELFLYTANVIRVPEPMSAMVLLLGGSLLLRRKVR